MKGVNEVNERNDDRLQRLVRLSANNLRRKMLWYLQHDTFACVWTKDKQPNSVICATHDGGGKDGGLREWPTKQRKVNP